MTSRPSPGIYDRLLDQDLAELLARYPELRLLLSGFEDLTSRQIERFPEPVILTLCAENL